MIHKTTTHAGRTGRDPRAASAVRITDGDHPDGGLRSGRARVLRRGHGPWSGGQSQSRAAPGLLHSCLALACAALPAQARLVVGPVTGDRQSPGGPSSLGELAHGSRVGLDGGRLWAANHQGDGSGAAPASIIAVEFDAPAAGRDFVTGDTIRLRLGFSRSVSVATTNGIPTAAVNLGLTRNEKVPFGYSVEESRDSVLVFAHEVSDADIMDWARLSTSANSVSLNGATISASGTDVAADLTHPRTSSRYTVNRRTALKFMVIRMPRTEEVVARNDGSRIRVFGLGQSIKVTAWFEEAVHVKTDGGVPYVRLVQEGHGPYHAEYRRGSGTSKLEFIYEVKSGDTSDLTGDTILAIPANGLASWNGGLVLEQGLILNGDRITNERGIPVYHEHYQIRGAGYVGGGDVFYRFGVDGVSPVLDASREPTVEGRAVVLTYAEPLDRTSVPASSAFAVTVQGEPASVTDLAVGNTVGGGHWRYGKVTLQLASPVAADVDVTVSYEAPESDPIRDLGGNAAPAFTVTVAGEETATFSVVASPAQIEEGQSSTVTVSVTNGTTFAADQTIALGFGGSTASKGTDFTVSDETLILPAGSNSVTTTVTAVDDEETEPSETVTVTASRDGKTIGSATIAVAASDAPAALTATYANMPATHDGQTAFTFELRFSEEPSGVSYRTVRDSLFDVTNGRITSARRATQGSNLAFLVAAEPSAASDISLSVKGTTDCEAEHAVCTEDGRMLAGGTSATVAMGAPAVTMSVADTEVEEAEGATLDFTVTLSRAAARRIEVWYRAHDGTANAGADYEAVSSSVTFAPGETTRTISVVVLDDEQEEDSETVKFWLWGVQGIRASQITDPHAVGTIHDDDDAAEPDPLTARLDSVPASHTGEAFTFKLTFSEDFNGLSYRTLRDSAFSVTGASVTDASRRTQGSNRAWNITVDPASDTGPVAIELPQTTDCAASRAICTEDGRPLSNSPSATVAAAASASADHGSGEGIAIDDALAVLAGMTPDEARAALLGEETLSEARLAALDRLGNRNGRYDLGDMLSWIERCRRGGADCGTTSSDSVPPASAALLAVAAAGPGRRRQARMAGRALALLLAATAWSCTGDLVGPPAGDPAARTGNVAGPPAALSGPGLLTVEWTAPPGRRDIGVLLELEGPGIDAIAGADGLELHHSAAHGRHRIVVAGPLESGPLLRFRVPDRGQLARYRVRVLQVTGEDYGLVDAGEYRAAAAPN